VSTANTLNKKKRYWHRPPNPLHQGAWYCSTRRQLSLSLSRGDTTDVSPLELPTARYGGSATRTPGGLEAPEHRPWAWALPLKRYFAASGGQSLRSRLLAFKLSSQIQFVLLEHLGVQLSTLSFVDYPTLGPVPFPCFVPVFEDEL